MKNKGESRWKKDGKEHEKSRQLMKRIRQLGIIARQKKVKSGAENAKGLD
jgi:hypothetical protein